MQKPAVVQLASGKTAYRWSKNEKPCINHWYQTRLETDYWKIQKDFYCKETNVTYYRIVEYYNGDCLFSGKSLAQIREIMRDNTYRMVI